MRKAGGVINAVIVMAAASGIVAAKIPAFLTQHGGNIEISKLRKNHCSAKWITSRSKAQMQGKSLWHALRKYSKRGVSGRHQGRSVAEQGSSLTHFHLGSDCNSTCTYMKVDNVSCQRESDTNCKYW